MLQNDQPVPDFKLYDLDGNPQALHDYLNKITVLNFWSAECPHAARVDASLIPLLPAWGEQVSILSIASNANEPPALLKQIAAQRGLPLILLDPQNLVGDLYGAVITPHFFVIDDHGILRYQGAYDDVTFRQRTPTSQYLVDAVQSVLAGKRPNPAQTPPYGCAIVRYAP